MALLSARLLFVDRDGDNVLLDVVVVGCAETQVSPAVGEPLCFAFALPRDRTVRGPIERLLRKWADDMRVVEMDVRRRRGHDSVRLAVADTSMLLDPAAR
jgi:hypothetical protein